MDTEVRDDLQIYPRPPILYRLWLPLAWAQAPRPAGAAERPNLVPLHHVALLRGQPVHQHPHFIPHQRAHAHTQA